MPLREFKHEVPLIAQTSPQACWFASGRMVARWANKRPPVGPIRATGSVIDEPEAVAQATKYGGLSSRLIDSLAELFEFQRSPATRSAAHLVSLLTQKGPLWCPHTYTAKAENVDPFARNGHVFVLTGFEMNHAGEMIISINDPLPLNLGSRKTIPFNDFMAQIKQAGDFLHAF
jgi:hypothetical protein